MIKYPCDKAMTSPKSATYHKGCQMIKALRLKHKTNTIHISERYHRTKESYIKGQTRKVWSLKDGNNHEKEVSKTYQQVSIIEKHSTNEIVLKIQN
jgi:hypothetical protein